MEPALLHVIGTLAAFGWWATIALVLVAGVTGGALAAWIATRAVRRSRARRRLPHSRDLVIDPEDDEDGPRAAPGGP
jgi:hypothetical protein